jgi:hypothetical protein
MVGVSAPRQDAVFLQPFRSVLLYEGGAAGLVVIVRSALLVGSVLLLQTSIQVAAPAASVADMVQAGELFFVLGELVLVVWIKREGRVSFVSAQLLQ